MFARLSHLSFSHSDLVVLLGDVSLQLAPGWTGVVGGNGAGKTTRLRLIARELEPSAGQIRFDKGGALFVGCLGRTGAR